MNARHATKQAEANAEAAYFQSLLAHMEENDCKHAARYVSEHYFTGERSWVCLRCQETGVEDAA